MANKNSETREDATQLERQLNRIRYTEALGRRGFLRNVGLAGVSVAAGSILTSCLGSGHVVSAQAVPEVDVLNFALNLEYLEANLYQVIAGLALLIFGPKKLPELGKGLGEAFCEVPSRP